MVEDAKELEQQSIFFPELRGKHHSQCLGCHKTS
jgi:hypothetical protein